jgi:hypothetical protein
MLQSNSRAVYDLSEKLEVEVGQNARTRAHGVLWLAQRKLHPWYASANKNPIVFLRVSDPAQNAV